MPLRGETIGTAYVRILASGRGFDQSVKDQFDESDQTFERGGRDASNAWDKGFEDEQKKNKNIDKSLDRTMNRAFGEVEARNKFFNGSFVDRLNEKVVAKLKQSNPELSHAAEELGKHMSDGILRDFAKNGEFDLNLSTRLRDALNASQKDSDAATKKWRAEFQQTSDEIDKTLRESSRELVTFGQKVTSVYDTIRTSQTSMARDWVRDHDTIRQEMTRTKAKAKETGEGLEKLGNIVASAFGKGSRNNFLNFFGSFVAAPINAIDGLVKGFDALGTAAGNLAGTVLGGGGGFGKILGSLGGGALAAGAAIGGLALVLGTVVGALSLATGAVVALASSLGFALVGAAGAAAGALVPLAAGLLVTIIGFKNMDKEAKKAFGGVKSSWKDLGKATSEALFKDPEKLAKPVEGILKGLQPLMESLGKAVRVVFDNLASLGQSPGFKAFRNDLQKNLPGMIVSVGNILTNFGVALMGVWVAATPFVKDFLGWLSGVANQFAEFANSLSGQNRMSEFFTNAKTSLIAVSGFLGDVWNLLSQILDAGRGAGDSIFDSMGKSVQGWTAALKQDPQILSRWFADAKDFAKTIGELVTALGKLFDALDTEATRQFATVLTGVLGKALESTSTLLTPIMELIGKLDGKVLGLIGTLGAATLGFRSINSAIEATKLKMEAMGASAETAGGKMAVLKAGLKQAAGIGGLALVADGATRADGALSELELAAGGAATGFAVGGPWGAAIGGGVGLLVGLIKNTDKTAQATREAADAAHASATDWEGLAGTLDTVTGSTTKATEAFILDKLTRDGTIGQWEKLGVSARTVIDGVLGTKSAVEQLDGAETKLTASIQGHREEAIRLNNEAEKQSKIGTGAALDRADALGKQSRAETDAANAQQNALDAIKSGRKDVEDETAAMRKRTGVLTDWKRVIKGIPTKLVTRFQAGNLPTTLKQVARLADKYNLTPKQIRTLVDVRGIPVSQKKLRALIEELKNTGKLKPTPRVDINKKGADGKVRDLKSDLAGVQKKLTKAQVDIDNRAFTAKAKGIKSELTNVGNIVKTPKIHVDTAAAQADISSLKSSLNIPDEYVTIHVNTVHTGGKGGPTASGGVFFGAQTRLIGEAGPEAVVPLARPLSMVDPAVRAMSAFAQGLSSPTLVTSPSAQTIVDVGGISVITPTKDPGAVAQEVVNRLVATGY